MTKFKSYDELIRIVEEADTDNFVDLVHLANLDPKQDFRYANLSGVDFSNLDLSGFNFHGSNLDNCIFDGARISQAIFTHTIVDEIALHSAVDFDHLLSNVTWKVAHYLDRDDFHEAIREMYRGLSSIKSIHMYGNIRNDIRGLIEDERRIRMTQASGAALRGECDQELKVLKGRYLVIAERINEILSEQVEIDGKGRRNVKTIGQLRRGLGASQAVCRIGHLKSGIGAPHFWGTGFLIADGWMVTTAHNFMLPNDERPRDELLRRCLVQFGYDDEYIDLPEDGVCQYKIDMDNVIYPYDRSIDCVIARLQPYSDHVKANHEISHWGHLSIEPTAMGATPVKLENHAVVLANDLIPLVRDLDGKPKQIAITLNEVLEIDDILWYTTDTERCSSGAPIFNENWYVVAVHLGISKKKMRFKNQKHQPYPYAGLPIRRVVLDKNLRAAFSEKS